MLEALIGLPKKKKVVLTTELGPQTLIGGTSKAGYYGTVDTSNFITAAALAQAVGVSVGSVINSTYPWLKFAYNDKILFIPQRSIRNYISWGDLYAAGVVYGDDTTGKNPMGSPVVQNKRVTIGKSTFKVRLMNGSNVDPALAQTGYDTAQSWYTEWNDLMYSICTTNPTSQRYTDWASFSESQLGTVSGSNNGEWSYCKEQIGTGASRVIRGGYGLSSYWADVEQRVAYYGWRPVLELESYSG